MEEIWGDSSDPPDHGRPIWFGDADKTEDRRRCTMGERQSRPVSLADDQAHGREIPPGRKRRGQVAVAVLSIVAALSQIAIPAGSARAQETPAKNDAAAKTDAPQETTPTYPS